MVAFPAPFPLGYRGRYDSCPGVLNGWVAGAALSAGMFGQKGRSRRTSPPAGKATPLAAFKSAAMDRQATGSAQVCKVAHFRSVGRGLIRRAEDSTPRALRHIAQGCRTRLPWGTVTRDAVPTPKGLRQSRLSVPARRMPSLLRRQRSSPTQPLRGSNGFSLAGNPG